MLVADLEYCNYCLLEEHVNFHLIVNFLNLRPIRTGLKKCELHSTASNLDTFYST